MDPPQKRLQNSSSEHLVFWRPQQLPKLAPGTPGTPKLAPSMPKLAPGMAILAPSTAKMAQARKHWPQIGVHIVIFEHKRHVKSGPGAPKLASYWRTYGDL